MRRTVVAGLTVVLGAFAALLPVDVAEGAPSQTAPSPDLYAIAYVQDTVGLDKHVSVHVGNRGAAATGVRVEFAVPAGLTVRGATHGWFARPCTVSATAVSCVLGAVATTTAADRFVVFDVTPSSVGSFDLAVTAVGNQPDAAPADNATTATLTWPAPDLAVTIDVDADVQLDETFEAWADVTHTGIQSPNAVVTFDVSEGLVIEGATYGWWQRPCAIVGSTATCNLGQMSNSSKFVILRLRAVEPGAPTVTATLGGGPDRNPANDVDTVTVSIGGAAQVDLSLRIVPPRVVGPGAPMDIYFQVTNDDEVATATGIVFTSTAPDGFVVTGATADGGSCTIDGPNVSCPVADLAPGYSRAVRVYMAASTVEGSYEVSGAVSSSLPDPRPIDNVATGSFIVGPPELDVYAQNWPTSATVDVPFSVLLHVANRGAASADSWLDITLSPGLTIDAATVGYLSVPCTITASGARCRMGALSNTSRWAMVTFRATAPGVQTMTAVASDPAGELDPSNNEIVQTVTVVSAPTP